jgi:DNA-binding MarR family transcriptional regulator
MDVDMQLSDRIGRRMKLHDLHVLMAVVQAGSMSKAAQLLNTTQPAISRSIADLEHAIGVRLLDRGRLAPNRRCMAVPYSKAEQPCSTTCDRR